MDMKRFKTRNVFLGATVQKSEGRGIREGQWQSCSGTTDVCSGPESLCAIPGNRKMEEEQATRAGHTGGHHEHDMQSQHSWRSVQDPQTNHVLMGVRNGTNKTYRLCGDTPRPATQKYCGQGGSAEVTPGTMPLFSCKRKKKVEWVPSHSCTGLGDLWGLNSS